MTQRVDLRLRIGPMQLVGNDRNKVPRTAMFMMGWKVGRTEDRTAASHVEGCHVNVKQTFLIKGIGYTNKGKTLRLTLYEMNNNSCKPLAGAKVMISSTFELGKSYETTIIIGNWLGYPTTTNMAVKVRIQLSPSQGRSVLSPVDSILSGTDLINTQFGNSFNSMPTALSDSFRTTSPLQGDIDSAIASIPHPDVVLRHASRTPACEIAVLHKNLNQMQHTYHQVGDEITQLEKEELELRDKIAATQVMFVFCCFLQQNSSNQSYRIL